MEEKKIYEKFQSTTPKKPEYFVVKTKSNLRIIEFDKKREADVLEKLRAELKEINDQRTTDIAIVKKQ